MLEGNTLPSVFFDVTRLQSDVGRYPTSVLYVLPYKNPCVTARVMAVRTWASGNSTLLMHALRWRPSRLVLGAKRIETNNFIWGVVPF